MNGNLNEDSVSKIAEIAAERLITSRQQEIINRSLELAKGAINESVVRSLSDFESALNASKNSIKDEARSTINQAISSRRSEISTEIKSLAKEEEKIIESKIVELSKRLEEFSSEKKDEKERDFNYTTRGTYEGVEVRFALAGQVLTPEEETEFGNINYIEFGTASCVGLALYTKTVGTTTQVWIGAGTVAGRLPSGFDPAEGKSIASGGSGDVWAEVNIDGLTGDIISVAVAGGEFIPNNTNTSFYYTLGHYEYDGRLATVTNYGCGSLDVTVCRNWFVSQAPYYGVTFSR